MIDADGRAVILCDIEYPWVDGSTHVVTVTINADHRLDVIDYCDAVRAVAPNATAVTFR